MKRLLVLLVVLAGLIAVMIGSGGIRVVDQTEYGVLTTLGKVNKVVKEDSWRLVFFVPGLQKLDLYPARLQTYDAPAEPIVTLDKKSVILDNYFKWKIDSVVLFRNAVGNVATANSRLASIVYDALKDALGASDLTSIISGSQLAVLQRALDIAKQNARNIGVEIVDVRFKKVQLPESNELRIYERMKSERNREAAYYRSQGREDSIRIVSETDHQVVTILAEAYREAQEIMGESEALAAEIHAKAYNRDPEFYSFWRTLQSYRETLDTATTLFITPESDLYKYLGSGK